MPKKFCREQKNEIFHAIIFGAVFLYFVVLKLMGYINISWDVIYLPIALGTILWLLVKLAKVASMRWKRNQLTKRDK